MRELYTQIISLLSGNTFNHLKIQSSVTKEKRAITERMGMGADYLGPLPGSKDFLVLQLLYTGCCSNRHRDDNVVNIK